MILKSLKEKRSPFYSSAMWHKKANPEEKPYTISPQLRAFLHVNKPTWNYIKGYVKIHFPSEYLILRKCALYIKRTRGLEFVAGIFPCLALHLSVQAGRHADRSDHPLGLCCVIGLGGFKGAPIYCEQIYSVIFFEGGYILFFRSNMLTHGNGSMEEVETKHLDKGRNSIVLFACKRLLQWSAKQEGIQLSREDFMEPAGTWKGQEESLKKEEALGEREVGREIVRAKGEIVEEMLKKLGEYQQHEFADVCEGGGPSKRRCTRSCR
ncbi:hypothetical protein HK097_005477 [Rhizophlyctis rosea]|uniref:Uncharacterized protein n=1 Tax=Rhizophlyctis rosea TaxID=64517 RepID=A0AAD5X6U0_9FUNG|nr:hypothetical protein HK097_005477 [Rhizophlyctis rosea]